MKLIFLIGNTAVGKMTVGQELMKITGLRLFHNHMTIEQVVEVFGYRDGETVRRIRDVFFEEFAKSDLEGLIFTYVWAFDERHDWDYVEHVSQIFREQGAEIYYVELLAPQEIRLQRNVTENRLLHKATKRDLEVSKQRLLKDDERYRLESYEGEIKFPNYLRIENSKLSAAETAAIIKEKFGF